MNNRLLQSTLQQVFTTKKSYDLVAKNTGEKFNIFSILGMESLEVKTHSRFLSELLNPSGTHLRGDTFLNLFVNYCNEKIRILNETEAKIDLIDFYSIQPEVVVEYPIGKVQEGTLENNFQNARGGRVDILVSNNSQAIVIENKIYAFEQEQQLVRYSNFLTDKGFKKHLIIYLTLDGIQPTSHLDVDKDRILCLSYKEDIVNWLELCKKEVVDYPTIREGITQYLFLIKKLTGQTLNNNLSMDIQDIILKNIDSAKLIHDNFEKAIFNTTSNFRNNIIEKLVMNLGNEFKISESKLIRDKDGFAPIFLSHTKLPNKVMFGIESFNFFRPGHRNGALFYGVWSEKANFKEIEDKFNFESTADGWWREIIIFRDSNEKEIRINDPSLIEQLNSNKFLLELTDIITSQFIEYLNYRSCLYK